MTRLVLASCALATFAVALAPDAASAQFRYLPAGDLLRGSPASSPAEVALPNLRFPIESAPAFLNSQIFAPGGGWAGETIPPEGRGSQCADVNYSYPWRDTFCEGGHQGGTNPRCGHNAHQGDDIRAGSCPTGRIAFGSGIHSAVASLSGRVVYSRSTYSYKLSIDADDGTRLTYLHMSRPVANGTRVECGDHVGTVSNRFFDSHGRQASTTVHLHFEIWRGVRGVGIIPVPPYMSLVHAYERLLAGDRSCSAPTVDAGPDASRIGDGSVGRDAGTRASPDANVDRDVGHDTGTDAAIDRCAEITTCGDCTAAVGCGFCQSDHQCHGEGYETSCADWRGAWFECTACEAIADCSTCAVSGCGWCADSNRCMTARSGGGPLGACADWHYTDTLEWCAAHP